MFRSGGNSRTHTRTHTNSFLVNFAVNQGDSRRTRQVASARDLNSFPTQGWLDPSWAPLLPIQRWVHLAGVYARDRIQLFVDGALVAQVLLAGFVCLLVCARACVRARTHSCARASYVLCVHTTQS